MPVRVAIAAPRAGRPLAPVMHAAPASPVVKVKASDTIHVVESGQTLYSIARQHGARVDDVIALNGLRRAGDSRWREAPHSGRRLAGRGGARDRLRTGEASRGLAPRRSRLGSSSSRAAGGRAAAPEVVAASARSPAAPACRRPVPGRCRCPEIDSGRPGVGAGPDGKPVGGRGIDPPSTNGTSFRWPLRGRISPPSAPNRTARERRHQSRRPGGDLGEGGRGGTVIYAGNELAGYGNLVLIRHADGWVTAYAHNSDLRSSAATRSAAARPSPMPA